MGALKKENTTWNSRIHLHDADEFISEVGIYTPNPDKQSTDSGGGEKKRRMTEDVWTMFYHRWLSICPQKESHIKLCLDYKMDSSS